MKERNSKWIMKTVSFADFGMNDDDVLQIQARWSTNKNLKLLLHGAINSH